MVLASSRDHGFEDVLNVPFSDHSSNYEMRIREICQRAEMTSLGYLRAPMELLASENGCFLEHPACLYCSSISESIRLLLNCPDPSISLRMVIYIAQAMVDRSFIQITDVSKPAPAPLNKKILYWFDMIETLVSLE